MSATVELDTTVSKPGSGMRAFLAFLLVLLVSGGGFALGAAGANEPFPDASGRINDLYEQGAAALIAALDPRALESLGLPPEQAEGIIQNELIARSGPPVSEQVIMVGGVPLTVVTTAVGATFCVRPDGVVNLLCIVGEMTAKTNIGTIAGDTGLITLVSDGAAPGLLARLAIEDVAGPRREITSAPQFAGSPGTWELVGLDQLEQGQVTQPTSASYFFGETSGLLFSFFTELDDDGGFDAGSFEIGFDVVQFGIDLPYPTFWLS